MSRTLTASDRSSLIRLASSLPVGSAERKAILAGLSKVAMEHASPEALKTYLKEHPNADPKNHTVKKQETNGKKDQEAETTVDNIMGRSQGNYFKKLDPEGFRDLSEALSKGGPAVQDSLDVASAMDDKQQKVFVQALKNKKSPYEAAAEALGKDNPELKDREENLKKHTKVDTQNLAKADKALRNFDKKRETANKNYY